MNVTFYVYGHDADQLRERASAEVNRFFGYEAVREIQITAWADKMESDLAGTGSRNVPLYYARVEASET